MSKTGIVAAFFLAWLAPALDAQERFDASFANDQPDATKPGSGSMVKLEVDPRTGKIRARTPGRRPGRGNVNGSFDFISATCTDCGGACPSFSRTVEVVLEANTPVSSYGAGGVVSGNYTLTSLSEVGNDPIAAGEQVTFTFTGDVLSCSTFFGIFFDVCSPVSPASPTGGCAPVQAQVNTYTTNFQFFSDVAMEPGGDFVVVWVSYGSAGNDNSGYSVQAQRHASNGSPVGGEFQVNTYTLGDQERTAVTGETNGDFVVVWASDGSSGSDTSDRSILGRRFASDGTALASEFQVNAYTTDRQHTPSAAADADGDFVVVWRSRGSVGSDTASYSIQGQRYASDGSTLGGQFQVNTYTTGSQGEPAVARNAGGDFVVAWASNGSGGTDTVAASVQAQRYASDGTAAGSQFQVNTFTGSSQSDPALAIGSGGDFIVTWRSDDDTICASIPEACVRGRRYGSDGSTLGAAFTLGGDPSGHQVIPVVALDSAGNFVTTWSSDTSVGDDTSDWSVQGQLYASDGTAIGSRFQVNTYTNYRQFLSNVATTPAGDFVVVWSSRGSSETDTSGYSVQRQVFFGPVQ